jgi:hypothetical protein
VHFFIISLLSFRAENNPDQCLRKLLLGLFRQELEAIVFHCDNQSCIKLFENPVFHDRSKHINIRYHFIQIVYREES